MHCFRAFMNIHSLGWLRDIKQMVFYMFKFAFLPVITKILWKRGLEHKNKISTTIFSVQLLFLFNRKSTSAADTFKMLQWINHCCWMISFTSYFELKLLILYIYWNIKSLICHLSWLSLIILAAACPFGV